MSKKWAGVLLGVIIIGIFTSPVRAVLNEGGFIPCSSINGVLTDAPVKPYRIQPGDTLWGICRTYDADLKTVMVMNNLDDNSTLRIGQLITIPCSRNCLHYISRGETIWGIAARYGINSSSLVELNPGIDPRKLVIGSTLRIPSNSYRIAFQEPSRGFSLVPAILSWPLVGTITSSYGWRKSGFHHGIDVAAAAGTPIKACAAGEVAFAGVKPYYGRTVIINHRDGKQTLYAHARDILVRKGQKVTSGQTIATVGTTGRTTGPHLHLEVKLDGKTCNPLRYLQKLMD